MQAEWLAKEFREKYAISNILVARPEDALYSGLLEAPLDENERPFFIYPTMPRVHKNVELACEVFLDSRLGAYDLLLTLSGKENRYAKWLFNKYGGQSNIKFIDWQSRRELFERYAKSSGLIFPSLLETWGLPLSEYSNLNKPIIVSDLPFYKEPVAMASKVVPVSSREPSVWADAVLSTLSGNLATSNRRLLGAQPDIAGWREFWNQIIQDCSNE